jgi:hypothetical protein
VPAEGVFELVAGSHACVRIRWRIVVRGCGERWCWCWCSQGWWWMGLLGRRLSGIVLMTLGDLRIVFGGLRGCVVFRRRVVGRAFA